MNRATTLHRFTIAAASAVVLLIFFSIPVGGRDGGLPVPEWPNIYGHFRIGFPGSELFDDSLREPVRDFLLWLNPLFTLGLAVAGIRGGFSARMRRLSFAALILAVAQVVAGGAVVQFPTWLSTGAMLFAQAQFCCLAMIGLATSQESASFIDSSDRVEDRRLRQLLLATTLAIAVQLVFGVVARAMEAGLAIPDIPTMFGGWIPPLSDARLAAANRDLWENGLIWKHGPAAVTRGMMIANLLHRLGAVSVAAMVILTARHLFREQPGREELRQPTRFLLYLLAAEILLGILTILTRRQFIFASAHAMAGALMPAASLVLTVRALRISLR